jgi:hypothetical protein
MADSNIIATTFTATGGIGQITLAWTASDPSEFKSLPYMQLDRMEVWASAANDRAGAVKVGESAGIQFIHSGLGPTTRRYYWVRARDKAGNLGEYFPLNANGGVTDVTGTTLPPANSVGEAELQNNAVSAAKIQAGAITAIKIDAGAVTAGKIASGAVTADTIAAGAITAVKIGAKAITADKLNVTSLDAISATLGNVTINGNVILGGTINGGKLQDGAITTEKATDYAFSDQAVSSPGSGQGQLASTNIYVSDGFAFVFCAMVLDRPTSNSSNYGRIQVSLRRDGTTITQRDLFYDDNFGTSISFFHADGPSVGNHTYSVHAQNMSGAGQWSMRGATVGVINCRK